MDRAEILAFPPPHEGPAGCGSGGHDGNGHRACLRGGRTAGRGGPDAILNLLRQRHGAHKGSERRRQFNDRRLHLSARRVAPVGSVRISIVTLLGRIAHGVPAPRRPTIAAAVVGERVAVLIGRVAFLMPFDDAVSALPDALPVHALPRSAVGVARAGRARAAHAQGRLAFPVFEASFPVLASATGRAAVPVLQIPIIAALAAFLHSIAAERRGIGATGDGRGVDARAGGLAGTVTAAPG